MRSPACRSWTSPAGFRASSISTICWAKVNSNSTRPLKAMINPPRGLIANLVTPLDSQGAPDGPALIRIMRRIGREAAAFLIGGLQVGEGLFLSLDHRLEVLAAAVEGADGRTVFFDVTTREAGETARFIDRANQQLEKCRPGCEVLYLAAPLVGHGNRDLPRHIKELGEGCRRRFLLSNDPELVGRLRSRLRHRNIRTAVLKKIAVNEQVAGLVFSGDIARVLNYQRAVRRRSGFRFYDGSEDNFLNRPSSSGLVSCGAALLPQAWSDIVGSSLNVYDTQRLYPDHLGQIWESGRMARELLDLYRDRPAAFIKKALKMMGIIDRDRLAEGETDLSPKEKTDLKNMLSRLQLV